MSAKKRLLEILNAALILQLAGLTQAYGYVYTVKEGDMLSRPIASRLVGGLVWGKAGSLAKILKLNPQITNPDFIRPGDQINLGDLAEAPLASQANSSSEREPAADVVAEHAPSEVAQPSAIAAQALVAKPTPVEVSDGSGTRLELSPFFAMTTLSATDSTNGSKATVSSNFYGGLQGKFLQIWDDSIRTNIHAQLSYVTFEDPTHSTSKLANSNKFLTTLGVSEANQLTSRINLDFSADLDREMFVRSLSTTSASVDSVNIPVVGAKLTFDAIQRQAFKLSLSGVFAEHFSASTDAYSISMGQQFGGGLSVIKKNAGMDQYQVELSALSRNQNTSVTSQNEMLYQLSFHLYFDQNGAK